MAYLTAAMVLIGLLTIVNLLLTVGVVRRLREHTTDLADLRDNRPVADDSDIALPAGSMVGSFDASGVDGRPVTLSAFGDRLLTGFFSPNCGPCKERLPSFIEYAAARPGGRDAVLAVAVGTPEETAELVERLQPVATVVREPDQGPVQKAFAVAGFPAFVLMEDGRVVTSHYDFDSVVAMDSVPLPASG